MRDLLKRIFRKIQRTVLRSTRQKPVEANALCDVKVGDFIIKIPAHNPLAHAYQYNPFLQNCLYQAVLVVAKTYPDLIAIDVGANIGDTLALIKSAANIPVICVEGDAYCAQVLTENSRQFADVTLIQVFLGEEEITQTVSISKERWNATLIPTEAAGGEAIAFTTLDRLLLKHAGRSRARVLKIDCEGYDLKILRGADLFIREVQPIILFEYNPENLNALVEDGPKIFTWLKERNYQRYFIFDHQSRFLFEATPENKMILDDLSAYLSFQGNCFSYVDIVAFPGGMMGEADHFAELSRSFRSGLAQSCVK